ncbi:MAG: hypothetical protein ACNY01_01190 [Desulfobacteria bacterium]
MRTLVVIPSYWTGSASTEPKITTRRSFDRHYRGLCLEKALTSFKILKEKDFQILVITATGSPKNQKQIDHEVMGIVRKAREKTGIPILLFPNTIMPGVQGIFREHCDQDALDFLRVDGYSNIRNVGLILAQVMGAEEVVFVDDDEYIDDPLFLQKAREYLGKSINGRIVAGVGGYYVDPQKACRRSIKPEPWKTCWDPERLLNETLCHLVDTQPRIKLTPLVLGGCLVLTRPLFALIPFDVRIPRGEDMDYLINARMFRFSIFFDNQLHIVHEPPPKRRPLWKRIQQDMRRFMHERAKLDHQRPVEGMDHVSVEEVMPYPGSFLGKDLEERFSRACSMLAEQADEEKSAREFKDSILLMRTDAAPEYDVFEQYLNLQKKWAKMCNTIAATRQLREETLALLPGFKSNLN